MGHDGPGHIAIAQEQPTLRALKLYHGKRGAGLSVEFKVRYGPVTIVGCTQTADGRLKLLAAEGESIPGETFRIGNTNSRLRFGLPPAEFLERWCARGPDPPRRARRRPRRRARSARSRRMLDLEYARGGLMERVCFLLRVRPDRLDEYKARHRDGLAGDARRAARRRLGQLLAVPRRRRAAGRLRRDRGLRGRAAPRWRRTDVNARWQARWPSSSSERPDTGARAPRGGLPPCLSYAAIDLGATSGRVVTGACATAAWRSRRPTASTTGRAAARRAALEPARTCSPRRSRGCGGPARSGGRRRRHVGRRLRAARRARPRARAPVPLPRRPHRGHGRARVRARPGRGALRRHRHPDAADQHRLPAAGRRGLGRARRRGADRARARPARALAVRRARQRAHQRLHHRAARRAQRRVGARR